MNLTRGDVARLGRKQEQPKRAPGELLAVFVAGKLVNTLNASGWHWQKRRRWAAEWKERTWTALLEGWKPYATKTARSVFMRTPKQIDFTLHVARLMDDDAWPGCVKPVRDALIGHVLSDDGPGCGHVFSYSQVKDGQRGVTVRIRLLAPRLAAGAASDAATHPADAQGETR